MPLGRGEPASNALIPLAAHVDCKSIRLLPFTGSTPVSTTNFPLSFKELGVFIFCPEGQSEMLIRVPLRAV